MSSEELRDIAEAYVATIALQAVVGQVGRLFVPPKAVVEFDRKVKELASLAATGLDVTDTEISIVYGEAISTMINGEIDRIYNLCNEELEEEDELDHFQLDFEKWQEEIAADGITTEEN